MEVTIWTQARQGIIYPLIFVFGMIWGHLFLFRWQQRRHTAASALWAAILGFVVALWAASGFVGIWVARSAGTTAYTTIIFTLGSTPVAMALVIGVIWVGKHIRIRSTDTRHN